MQFAAFAICLIFTRLYFNNNKLSLFSNQVIQEENYFGMISRTTILFLFSRKTKVRKWIKKEASYFTHKYLFIKNVKHIMSIEYNSVWRSIAKNYCLRLLFLKVCDGYSVYCTILAFFPMIQITEFPLKSQTQFLCFCASLFFCVFCARRGMEIFYDR